jgi:eukaryotic-like serine/threonine-protein kinase
MTIAAGTRLGPYEVVEPIGAGGMGEVYRAHDSRLGRDVAVKIIAPHLSDDPRVSSRFEREAKAVAAISHPNILAIHDYGTSHDIRYAAVELLEGETLRARLTASGTLPLKNAVDYAQQIAQGLAAAHAKGIVHRDLKPENVFITDSGIVKILDFGLAQQRSPLLDSASDSQVETSVKSTPGQVLGTLGYMAPEQLRGSEIDHRADIFAFGALLYEMLTGTRAFWGQSVADTIAAILSREPPPCVCRTALQCLIKRVRSCGVVWKRVHPIAISQRVISRTTSKPCCQNPRCIAHCPFAYP